MRAVSTFRIICFTLTLAGLMAGTASHTTAQVWTQMADYPGVARDDGTSFTIGDIAWCGSGLLPWWVPAADFHALHLPTGEWQSGTITMPAGAERQYACAFSHGGHGFIVAGVGESGFLNDVWRYNGQSNTWETLTPMPTTGRSGSACFQLGSRAYMVGGVSAGGTYHDEVWMYDLEADTWEQKAPYPGIGLWRGSAAAVQGTGYAGFGFAPTTDYSNELFRYDESSDTWSPLTPFPGNGRSYAALIPNGSDLILFAGIEANGTYHNDLWQYHTAAGSWSQLQDLPDEGRKGGMVALYDGGFYYTTGINSDDMRLTETWKYQFTTGLDAAMGEDKLLLYPNPGDGNIRLGGYSAGVAIVMVYDQLGRVVWGSILTGEDLEMDISHLSAGCYAIGVSTLNSRSFTAKYIKY